MAIPYSSALSALCQGWRASMPILLSTDVLSRKLVYVRAAGPLTVTILSIAITCIFKLYNAPANIKVVGTIPKVTFLNYYRISLITPCSTTPSNACTEG